MVTEIGLDSRRNGEHTQARALDWQVRTAMASGCAGAFVFAWTDEWFRGGQEVGDWDFGLTTRRRQPKPALAAVQEAFTDAPFPRHMSWPRISVVVCTHNGGRTLPECLEGLRGLDYPNYEVIVVNDGSTDNSAVIASLSGYRLINTEHRGLSHARNAGLAVAEGEIVVYIDDDAFPDPDWLKYLAATFLSTSHAGVGGPNLPPLDDGPLAQCVANAPGGPMHVLLTDSEAEHIPGCNMAFRKCWLTEIGGFDPQFRVAGDDVDICWRLQERGLTIGFNPAALVWHRRRNSIRAYLRQQKGYGAAEALLQEKWPDKYNLLGQAIWSGRLYGKGLSRSIGLANRIYHGAWGSAPYQILQPPDSSVLRDVPAMPEWTLIILALGFLSVLGWLWPPLLLAVPLFALAVGITLYRADLSVAQAGFPLPVPSRFGAFGLRVLSVALHLMQPWARLWGRMFCGRQPEHSRTSPGLAWPLTRKAQIWSEQWQAPERLLKNLESAIREEAGVLVRGGDYDRWDLELRRGSLAAVRLYMTVEEHGAGRQMFRFRLSPYYTAVARMVVLPPTALAAAAAVDHAWTVTVILVALSIYATALALLQCGSAMAILKKVLQRQGVMQPARVVPSAGDGETAMKASRKTPASPIGEVTLQRPVV
jgi:GT2 family glycosyltransferase